MVSDEKEPEFYPFKLKNFGWVLRIDADETEIAKAFKELVYELVTKDFKPDSPASKMYKDAVEMMNKASQKGRELANARWEKQRAMQMPTKYEMYDFACDHNLDSVDCMEWYERTSKNGWKDGKGKNIVNWKGALTNYCKERLNNRKNNQQGANNER